MSAAEVIAQITALSPAEGAQVVQQSLDQLDPELLKLVERKLRRLLNPEVPDEVWTWKRRSMRRRHSTF